MNLYFWILLLADPIWRIAWPTPRHLCVITSLPQNPAYHSTNSNTKINTKCKQKNKYKHKYKCKYRYRYRYGYIVLPTWPSDTSLTYQILLWLKLFNPFHCNMHASKKIRISRSQKKLKKSPSDHLSHPDAVHQKACKCAVSRKSDI